MDWLVFCDFIECVRQQTKEVPIDVYDMAAWMSVTALSEQSIAMGGHPVPIPDFTMVHGFAENKSGLFYWKEIDHETLETLL